MTDACAWDATGLLVAVTSECTSASTGGAACLLGAIMSLSHHLDVQGVRPGTQSRLQSRRHAALYPVAYGEREDAANTGKATPSQPPPHGLRPAVLQSCSALRELTVHLLCIPVTAGIFKSDCSPLRLLKTLVYVCRAALHLGKHKQKLPAYSVLPTSLSHHLDSPRRYAQHCPCWPIGGLLVIAGQHSRVGTSQGRDLPGPGRTLAATLCALASR